MMGRKGGGMGERECGRGGGGGSGLVGEGARGKR